jgi:hypothetical protein
LPGERDQGDPLVDDLVVEFDELALTDGLLHDLS